MAITEEKHGGSEMNCTVPDCTDTYKAKGYCERHYKRNLLYGSPYYRPGKQMRDGEWALILSMEQMPDITLDSLVGSTGLWRQHCARFKKGLKRRIEKVRKMTLPRQCAYYRGIAYVRAGQ